MIGYSFLLARLLMSPDSSGGGGATGGASGSGASGGGAGTAGGSSGAGAGASTGAAPAAAAAAPAAGSSASAGSGAEAANPTAATGAAPKAFDWSGADWSSVGIDHIPQEHHDRVFGLFKDQHEKALQEKLMKELGPLQIELGWLRGDESQYDKLPQTAEMKRQIDEAKQAGELSAKEAAELKKQVDALSQENNGFKEYIAKQAEEANGATKLKHPRLFSDKEGDRPLQDSFLGLLDVDFDVDLAADIAVLGSKTVQAVQRYMKENGIRPDQERLIRQFVSSKRADSGADLVGAAGGSRGDAPKSYNDMMRDLEHIKI